MFAKMCTLSTVCPIDREWVHEWVLLPYLEGVERINLAWQGINFHSLMNTALSWKKRIISFFTGLILLIPIINLIVWRSWEYWGNPRRLSDPFCPSDAVVMPQKQRYNTVAAVEDSQNVFIYKIGEQEVERKISVLSDRTQVLESGKDHFTTSIFNEQGRQVEFRHRGPEGLEFDIELNKEKNIINITMNDSIKHQLILSDNIPWIQQSTLGLFPFIQSDEQEIEFYTVAPKDPLLHRVSSGPVLMKYKATKVASVENTVPVEIELVAKWTYKTASRLGKGTIWFDKETGIAQKWDNPPEAFSEQGERS